MGAGRPTGQGEGVGSEQEIRGCPGVLHWVGRAPGSQLARIPLEDLGPRNHGWKWAAGWASHVCLTAAPTPTVPVSWAGEGPWQELLHDVCGSRHLPAWRQWGHHTHHR